MAELRDFWISSNFKMEMRFWDWTNEESLMPLSFTEGSLMKMRL